MNNYVLEYLADATRAAISMIERIYQEDTSNPLQASRATTDAITQARWALDNVGTSLAIDGRKKMATTVIRERDAIIALEDEASKGEGGLEEEYIIFEIKEAFERVIEMLEEGIE